MKSVRLLPIVVFATSALLILKVIGLATQGGYVLLGTSMAQAQTQQVQPGSSQSGQGGAAGAQLPSAEQVANVDAGQNPAPAAADAPAPAKPDPAALKPEDAAAAKRAQEALFADQSTPPDPSASQDGVPYTKTKSGEKIPLRGSDGLTDTERAVLERLGERRTELDKRAKDLDTRQALVDAAEKRLSERIDALKALEARISQLVDEKKALDDKQFAGLVSMYESMKAKDAAAIFDQLSMDVLLRVASAMNPRKMAPVLAAMSPDKAQQLTVQMASKDTQGEFNATPDDLAALPQIVGK